MSKGLLNLCCEPPSRPPSTRLHPVPCKMGSGASVAVPEEFEALNDEEKQRLQTRFEELIKSAKSQEEAIQELVKEVRKDPFGITPAGKVKIPLIKMLEAIDWCLKAGLTPLVLDPSEDNKVDTFFSYQSASVLDGKKMGLDVSMRNVPIEQVMEEARQSLVAALKFGNILVIAMTQSATDFATKFNDTSEAVTSSPLDLSDGKKYLPLETFANGGRGLLEEEMLNALWREEDKDQGIVFARDPEKFHCVITSRFGEEDFEEFLFENDYGLPKPKEQYAFIIIEENADGEGGGAPAAAEPAAEAAPAEAAPEATEA